MPGDWIEEKRRKHLQDILQDDRMPKRQRETLQELERRWRLDGQTVTTRHNKASMARRIGKFLDKPFEEATREDIETYLANKSENVAQATLNSYKRFIKAFFKDLLAPEAEDHPPVVSWINLKNPLKATKIPNDLVTPDEVLQMAEAATRPRDRALTMVLYESAARLGEVLSTQIRDVAFDQYGARLHLKGKTGERKVRLLRSVPDLRTWLNHHPRRDDPDAPLFVSYSSRNRHGMLRLSGARRIVKQNAEDAGLDKRVYPHLLRHSRLTELAKDLSESELKVVAGWSADSKMAKVYIHLSGDDVDKKLLRKAGLLDDEEEDEDDALETQVCPKCSQENSAAAAYCTNCSLPLDEGPRAELLQEDQDLKEILPTVLEVLEDPEVARLIAEKLNALDEGDFQTTGGSGE